MTDAPTITMVGAGGMSFGPTMVSDLVHTRSLRGARMVLHDVDPDRLDRAYRFAVRCNAAAGAPVVIDRTTDPARAFTGADFVISSAEFRRFERWRQDYEVPLRHGATHVMGENGGPGAVFHSLRSIANTLRICADVERHAPDAFFVNLTNPMSRVTLAISRATGLRHVGMCHEMPLGLLRLCRRLGWKRSEITARASGINHFTFFTEIRNERTGEDLLPQVREFYARRFFDYPPRTQRIMKAIDRNVVGGFVVEFNYMPLVVHLVREYGLVPCSVDSHIGEYLPFGRDVADFVPAPIDFHEPVMRRLEQVASWAATTRLPLPLHRMGRSDEEVMPLIAALWTGKARQILAVNVANRGFIPDVAEGAIVEVGATVDGDGIHPDTMAPLGEPLAGWVATQTAIQDLVVEAALTGDPEIAFEAVRADPTSPPDPDACRRMFDELRTLQADQLPF